MSAARSMTQTVASLSRRVKRCIKTSLELTTDDPDAELPFKLPDFGARGASSAESAGLGGMAHLTVPVGAGT